MTRLSGRSATLYGAVLVVGIACGFALRGYTSTNELSVQVIREPQGKYTFINPLIGFSVGSKEDFEEYVGLERTLQATIASLQKKQKVHSASVYFRDMESGRWTGVNEEDLYSPASLYKVALMIAVLKYDEDNPDALEKHLTFTESRQSERLDYPPMKRGTYSVRELLDRLIRLSDNDAKDVLRDFVGAEAVSSVFTALRLAEPALSDVGDTMSARTYSRFFRTLYNSSYLNRNDSEYALRLLSQVGFKSGLVNGLPPEARTLPIAHKFGYRVVNDPTDSVTEELHDCGIVYLPSNPYFICIMTKGSNQNDLLDAIQLLSRVAYDAAIARKSTPSAPKS